MTAPTKTKTRPAGPKGHGRPRKPRTGPKVNPAKRPTNISDGALRQAFATLNREPLTIPASWWDEDVAENMSEWVKHRGAALLRKRFGGRK